jgi:predicted RNA binding protein YcfA (HicA-like mRNA interferase family)
VKIRDVTTLIEENGSTIVVIKHNHRQLKHPRKSGRVTSAGHPGDDLAPETHNTVLKQDGL